MRPQDEIQATPIVLVGVISAILLFAIIAGLSALFLHLERKEAYSKWSPLDPEALRRNRSRQMEALAAYEYLDQANGIVRIPIERAMELVTEERAGESKSGDDGR